MLRNALGDLRVAIREGLAREVDAGVSKLTLLKWNMVRCILRLGGGWGGGGSESGGD